MSQEAIDRREKVRRKELQDKGDEQREQALLRAQIKRAQMAAEARGDMLDENEDDEGIRTHELNRQEGERIKLQFGPAKPVGTNSSSASRSPSSLPAGTLAGSENPGEGTPDSESGKEKTLDESSGPKPVSLKFGAKPQPKNVFKNAFSGAPRKVMAAPPKKMSEAERIMKEEIERKRAREEGSGPPSKKMKFKF